MTKILFYPCYNFVYTSIKAKIRTRTKRSNVVNDRKNSLEMCCVVNQMGQTSHGWEITDRDSVVDAMVPYADAGLVTFDMADICKH